MFISALSVIAVFVVLSIVIFGLEIVIVRLVRTVKGRDYLVLAALRINGIKPGSDFVRKVTEAFSRATSGTI